MTRKSTPALGFAGFSKNDKKSAEVGGNGYGS